MVKKKKGSKDKLAMEELQHSIDELEHRIEEDNKPRSVFIRGLIKGLGASIGATILFALLVAGLSWALYQLDIFPGLSNFIDSLQAEELSV